MKLVEHKRDKLFFDFNFMLARSGMKNSFWTFASDFFLHFDFKLKQFKVKWTRWRMHMVLITLTNFLVINNSAFYWVLILVINIVKFFVEVKFSLSNFQLNDLNCGFGVSNVSSVLKRKIELNQPFHCCWGLGFLSCKTSLCYHSTPHQYVHISQISRRVFMNEKLN